MAFRLHRIPLLTQVILVSLLAYLLHYATLPVPDDLNQRDAWVMRFTAMGIDVVSISRFVIPWKFFFHGDTVDESRIPGDELPISNRGRPISKNILHVFWS